MLTAAAFVPTPPLLVPAVAGGSPDRDADLRTACRAAVRRLLDSDARRIAVVGQASATRVHQGSWDWRAWGVASPAEPVHDRLPLTLAVGAWLLDDAGESGARVLQAIGAGTTCAQAAAVGAALVDDGPVGLLVCGDGSARRDVKAPGHFDGRAEAFDAGVEGALRSGDPRALLDLDPVLADALLANGLVAWQALAGAAAGATWTAEISYAAAPYGVGYLVGHWTR